MSGSGEFGRMSLGLGLITAFCTREERKYMLGASHDMLTILVAGGHGVTLSMLADELERIEGWSYFRMNGEFQFTFNSEWSTPTT